MVERFHAPKSVMNYFFLKRHVIVGSATVFLLSCAASSRASESVARVPEFAGGLAPAVILLVLVLAAFGSWFQDGNSTDGVEPPNIEPDASAGEDQSLFEQLFLNLPVAAMRCDLQGRIVLWNRAGALLFNQTDKQVQGSLVWEVVAAPPYQNEVKRQIEAALVGRRVAESEIEMQGADGSTHHILCHSLPLLGASQPEGTQEVCGAIYVCLDQTTHKKSQDNLLLAEKTYQDIVLNSPQGVFRMTPDGEFLEVNVSLARIFNYELPEEMMSDLKRSKKSVRDRFFVEAERFDQLMRQIKGQGRVSEFEAQIKQSDSEPIWIEINAQAVSGTDGETSHIAGTIEDVSKRKSSEEKLLRDALHDKLTGLPNRALFMERLGRSMARLRRMPEYQFAVLFVDLDRFKIVNDSLGHQAGDQLLQMTSRKLEACLRPGDTVARMGGDEFAILLDDTESLTASTQVAERIQKRLSMPFSIGNQEIFTTASIGIVEGTPRYVEPEDLLRDADMAMYKAKQSGKAHHEVFDAAMKARANTELQLESDLRRAVQRNEFKLEYQPIVSLNSGRIAGFEALVRWRHPERGTISPGDFVPLAEETGLILPLGRWALREACRQVSVWQKTLRGTSGPVTMAVNLSARQFAQPDLVRYVEGILRQTKVDPRYLKLEITESIIMGNVDAATAMLLQFKELGIKLSIDDFGTGYSSLSYLHKFPISSLKIDRSFVSRMDVSDDNEQIVRTIVQLAHNLNMDVIAEGVETADQLHHLRSLEAEYGQGYYFGGPMDGQTAGAFAAAGPQW